MANHIGLCGKLIEALQELMPHKFADLEVDPRHKDKEDECFRVIIAYFAEKAVLESHLALEYAIACQQISEIYDPVIIPSNQSHPVNQFKYHLTNHLQIYVKTR